MLFKWSQSESECERNGLESEANFYADLNFVQETSDHALSHLVHCTFSPGLMRNFKQYCAHAKIFLVNKEQLVYTFEGVDQCSKYP